MIAASREFVFVKRLYAFFLADKNSLILTDCELHKFLHIHSDIGELHVGSCIHFIEIVLHL